MWKNFAQHSHNFTTQWNYQIKSQIHSFMFFSYINHHIQFCSHVHFVQGFFNPDQFDGVVSELDGLTVLDVSLPVPPGLTEEQYIMGATAWYYSNFTATGNPMKLGPIEVLSIYLNGD